MSITQVKRSVAVRLVCNRDPADKAPGLVPLKVLASSWAWVPARCPRIRTCPKERSEEGPPGRLRMGLATLLPGADRLSRCQLFGMRAKQAMGSDKTSVISESPSSEPCIWSFPWFGMSVPGETSLVKPFLCFSAAFYPSVAHACRNPFLTCIFAGSGALPSGGQRTGYVIFYARRPVPPLIRGRLH